MPSPAQPRHAYRGHLAQLTISIGGTRRRTPPKISPLEYRLVAVLLKNRRSWTQRELAAEAGYADASGVSRALGTLRKLGIIALSTTRGRYGSTVAWLRRGVHVIGHAAATLVRAMLPNRSGTVLDTGGTVSSPPKESERVSEEIGNIRSPLHERAVELLRRVRGTVDAGQWQRLLARYDVSESTL